MAIVMQLSWAGVTTAQYDELRRLVNWEGNVPSGAMFHVAAATESGMRATDVWESAEALQQFVDTRLMPGAQQLAIPGAPQVEVSPVHALFTPAYPRA